MWVDMDFLPILPLALLPCFLFSRVLTTVSHTMYFPTVDVFSNFALSVHLMQFSYPQQDLEYSSLQ